MHARKLVVSRFMPDNVGREDAAKRGLIAGLDSFDLGLGDVDVGHDGLLRSGVGRGFPCFGGVMEPGQSGGEDKDAERS